MDRHQGQKKEPVGRGMSKSFALSSAAQLPGSLHAGPSVPGLTLCWGSCGLQSLVSASPQLDSEDAEPNFDEDGRDEYNELHMPV